VLIAMWLLRLNEHIRVPDRFGPFADVGRRRALVAELREADPTVALLQVDVYANGEIKLVVPARETW
jgi:hypothetical protein